MAELSVHEQLLLELVNRARLDPLAEAARLGINLNQGLAAGTISATPKQVLAHNGLLNDAATGHSDWMLANDVFSHTGAGNSNPGNRMSAAGYVFTGSWTWGENIAWIGTTGTPNLTSYTLGIHDNLFRSPGHRVNILGANFRELGAGISQGQFTDFDNPSGPVTYNAVMATENFAKSGTDIFITGVAINDGDADRFYDIGEGRGGITVTVTSGGSFLGSDNTGAAGGYEVGVAAGTVGVTFSGGGLASSVSVTVLAGNANAKVDLVGTNGILTSASATLGEGAASLVLLGAANLNGGGNGGANTLIGNRAANVLKGHAGNDVIQAGSGNDWIVGGTDKDTLYGGLGKDRFDFDHVLETRSGVLRDRIMDFRVVDDTIDLSGMDAHAFAAGNQAFTWRGGAAFTGTAGQVRVFQVNSANDALDRTYVAGDTNGDRVADFQIEIVGLHGLTKADFVL